MTQATLFPKTEAAVEAPGAVVLAKMAGRPARPARRLEAISRAEAAELRRCEEGIEDRLEEAKSSFREIGKLLTRIRDERLYRASHGTFEEYCQARWHRSGRRMLQFWEAFGVVEDLVADGKAGLISEGVTASPVTQPAVAKVEKAPLAGSDVPSKPNIEHPTSNNQHPLGNGNGRNGKDVLPATESQARPLVPLAKSERRDVWNEAVRRADGGQPTEKLVRSVVEDRRWPKPNEHGVYEKEKATQWNFKADGAVATIFVLQIGEERWISTFDRRFPGVSVGCGGVAHPLVADGTFMSKSLAFANAATGLKEDCIYQVNNNRNAKCQELAKRIWAWVSLKMGDMPANAKGVNETRARVLEASQRAVVAVRALQDLVNDNQKLGNYCESAASHILRMESEFKSGRDADMEQELIWAARDAAADLGGLDERLRRSDKAALVVHVWMSLMNLKPLFDGLGIANLKVDRYASKLAEADKGKVNGSEREVYVIERTPIANATGKESARFRYMGNPGGWTSDPRKVTPFESLAEARLRCKSGDEVVTLAAALGRVAK